jgi:hypothetical protein
MDIWHGWLAKLVGVQILYLAVVIWGMRVLNRRASRIQVEQSWRRQPAQMTTTPSSVPFQKS